MPKPVYIICAAGLSEDRSTNLVTLFGFVESLVVAPVPIPDGTKVNFVKGPNNPGELGQLKVMAVWMKTSAAEDNVVFEHEFVLQFDDRFFFFRELHTLCREREAITNAKNEE